MRIGVLGLAATLIAAAWVGPSNSRQLENRVEAAAQQALTNGGYSWASARAAGQRIDLVGAAPSEEARTGARRAVMTSLGAGGLLAGGVTKVTTRGIDVVRVERPFTWLAQKERGQVSLEGFAESRASLGIIERDARQIFSNRVSSRMSIASGKPEGLDWTIGARAGLQAVQRMDQGSAQLTDNVLTISGSVANERVMKDVEALVQPARDAQFTVNVDLIPPPEWTAELADKRLTLTGRLPNQSVRNDIARAAQAAGVALEDRTELSDEASIWAPRAVAAMPNFLKFDKGAIMVQGRVFRISGDGLGSFQQYLREDMARIADEMSVRYALREVAPQIEEIAGVNLDATGEQKEESCQTAFGLILSSNTILFGTGDAAISRESGETLDKLVAVARRCSEFGIEVEGHTDNVGQAARNMSLSRARADAVLNYLTARGLPADQLSAVGYGQTRPKGDNATVAGRAQNRRIEFKVSAAEDR